MSQSCAWYGVWVNKWECVCRVSIVAKKKKKCSSRFCTSVVLDKEMCSDGVINSDAILCWKN